MRAVWCRTPGPPEDNAGGTKLMAFDSESGGIRTLVPAGDHRLLRPLILPDGSGVVFTEDRTPADSDGANPAPVTRIRAVTWDGATTTDLGDGVAMAVLRDPESGGPLVYALDSAAPSQNPRLTGAMLVRFRPDVPDDREIIWTATNVSADGFQVSRDATRASGFFPWPQAGLADLDSQSLTPVAHGNWAGLASDDSYAMLVLDGSQRRLRFFAPGIDTAWEINPAALPDLQDATAGIRHPRWSNDPSVVAFSGPWTAANDAATGEAARPVTPGIFAVRLRDDLRRIESSVRLTRSDQWDSQPDIRIEGGAAAVTSLPQQPAPAPPAAHTWPLSTDDLVFAWENAQPSSTDSAPLTARGFAHIGRHFDLDLSAGWFEASPEAGDAVAAACSRSGWCSLEFILTERRTEPPVSVRLVTLRHPDGHDLFALYRVDRKLVARVLTGPSGDAVDYPMVLTSLAIQDDRPCHVVLNLHRDRLECYIDGRMVKDHAMEGRGLGAWSGGRLFFGDPNPYGSPWTGWMERIAIRAVQASDDEIRQWAEAAAAWLEPRQRAPRIRVRAVLESPPRLEPGREQSADALAGATWRVDQVLTGLLDAPRIATLHRARINGLDVPSTFPGPGESAEFTLESPENHPEIDPARISSVAEDPALPVWLITVPPGRPIATAPPP